MPFYDWSLSNISVAYTICSWFKLVFYDVFKSFIHLYSYKISHKNDIFDVAATIFFEDLQNL